MIRAQPAELQKGCFWFLQKLLFDRRSFRTAGGQLLNFGIDLKLLDALSMGFDSIQASFRYRHVAMRSHCGGVLVGQQLVVGVGKLARDASNPERLSQFVQLLLIIRNFLLKFVFAAIEQLHTQISSVNFLVGLAGQIGINYGINDFRQSARPLLPSRLTVIK